MPFSTSIHFHGASVTVLCLPSLELNIAFSSTSDCFIIKRTPHYSQVDLNRCSATFIPRCFRNYWYRALAATLANVVCVHSTNTLLRCAFHGRLGIALPAQLRLIIFGSDCNEIQRPVLQCKLVERRETVPACQHHVSNGRSQRHGYTSASTGFTPLH